MSSGDSGKFDPVFGAAEVRRADPCPVQELHEIKEAVECGKCAYDDVRSRLLRLHAALNDPWEDGGRFAPAFRPLISPDRVQRNTLSEMIRRDQLRIDLHWLACSDLTEERFGNTEASEQALYALFREGVHATEIDTLLSTAQTTGALIRDVGVDRPRQIYCVWVCDEALAEVRSSLRKERDEHLRRLEERQRCGQDARDRRGLSHMKDLSRLCDVWLAEELARVAYDGRHPSHEIVRSFYISIVEDPAGSRDAVAKQRAQVAYYIRDPSGPSRREPHSSSNSVTARRALRESKAAASRSGGVTS